MIHTTGATRQDLYVIRAAIAFKYIAVKSGALWLQSDFKLFVLF